MLRDNLIVILIDVRNKKYEKTVATATHLPVIPFIYQRKFFHLLRSLVSSRIIFTEVSIYKRTIYLIYI